MNRFFPVAKCLFLLATIVSSMGEVYPQSGRSDMTIMFYNVENLFDLENDSSTRDGEFTEQGAKRWDRYRYNRKLINIYKVIIATGEWNLPVAIGLAEVENRKVLEDLIHFTPLKKFGYRIVHEESGDARGIDVALLYRKEYFKYLHHEKLTVPLQRPTRDILVVSGIFLKDTCHFIVNHWPSRMGGKSTTEHLRLLASDALVNGIDSLSRIYCKPCIMIMGDFNDGPDDASLRQVCQRKFTSACGQEFKMINQLSGLGENSGTLVHTDVFTNWYTFDQILVSEFITEVKGRIFKEDWLLDAKGERPKRTYLGDYYQGGISDHLPVYIKLGGLRWK